MEKHQDAVDEAVATGQFEPIVLHAEVTDDDPLTREQRARATAIWEARMTLERRGTLSGHLPPSVPQLLEVADYILDGRDEFRD